MSKASMELPDLGQKGDTFTLTREQYSSLLHKASGFEGQTEFFAKIRDMIEPTEKDTRLPWYDMLLKCIGNKQIKDYIPRLIADHKMMKEALEEIINLPINPGNQQCQIIAFNTVKQLEDGK